MKNGKEIMRFFYEAADVTIIYVYVSFYKVKTTIDIL